jgi:hypothetical protein
MHAFELLGDRMAMVKEVAPSSKRDELDGVHREHQRRERLDCGEIGATYTVGARAGIRAHFQEKGYDFPGPVLAMRRGSTV